jgi:hypothetical protein
MYGAAVRTMQSWHVTTAAHAESGSIRIKARPPASPADLLRYRRRIASHAGSRDPSTRESASTNGLPGTNHAHLAASSQRFIGGHNLTELRTDLARVTFLLDQMTMKVSSARTRCHNPHVAC